MVLVCRESWPKYATYKEDCKLRKDKWNIRYDGMRVVLWDNTNISMLFKPSNPQLQRITFSNYYSENCAKGGGFIQLCGWMGTHNLWVGASSDTMYLNKSDILKYQDEFSRKDLVDGKHIPFSTILDKGYRSTLAAWMAGCQLILQPDFKKSDKKFRREETISSAGIATDRSGNERGVKYSKYSGILARGMTAKNDFAMIDDIWLAWSFQTNFMYESPL